MSLGRIAQVRLGNLISYGAGKLISSGVIFERDLLKLVPLGMENGFTPSERIEEGFKYETKFSGVRIQVKWHSPDIGTPEGSNSRTGWTAQIKIGGRFLKSDGTFTRNRRENDAHIPIIKE